MTEQDIQRAIQAVVVVLKKEPTLAERAGERGLEAIALFAIAGMLGDIRDHLEVIRGALNEIDERLEAQRRDEAT